MELATIGHDAHVVEFALDSNRIHLSALAAVGLFWLLSQMTTQLPALGSVAARKFQMCDKHCSLVQGFELQSFL